MNRSDPRPARYRPGPLRWFWYAVGGRLPARYRSWVLHDLTCRTWPLRHLARLVAQLAPVAVVLVLLLPGPLWIRVMGALGGSLVGLFYSFVFLYEADRGTGNQRRLPPRHAARGQERAPDRARPPASRRRLRPHLAPRATPPVAPALISTSRCRRRGHGRRRRRGDITRDTLSLAREVRLAPARPPPCTGQPQVRPRTHGS